jgi:hypothetical protein
MKKKAKRTKKTSSPSFRRLLYWAVVFLLLLLATDQALLRLSFDPPLLREFQLCYREFRCRLTGGDCRQEPETIEAVIAGGEGRSAVAAQRYLYVDGQGALQFADRLEDVPAAYRNQAQPLAE